MGPVEYVANVPLIAIVLVLVLGGATAGVYALAGYLFSRARGLELGLRYARRTYRNAGAILLGVGNLGVLGEIPRFFELGGPVPGIWGVEVGGAVMVLLGGWLMVRFRGWRD